MAYGEADAQEVRLTGRGAARAHLSVVSIDPSGPDVTVLPATAADPPGLRVAMTGARVARVAGQVIVSTGLATPERLSLNYTWHVAGNLVVDPTSPFIDLRASPGPVAVRVSSRRPDFSPTRVATEGPFKAHLARDDAPGSYVVEVAIDGPRAPAWQRSFAGKLFLISNDPAEPRKEIPLFALGEVPASLRRR